MSDTPFSFPQASDTVASVAELAARMAALDARLAAIEDLARRIQLDPQTRLFELSQDVTTTR